MGSRLSLCSCVFCQFDAEKGRPLVTARWKDTGEWWACYRNIGTGTGTVKRREEATAFGPRHASGQGRFLAHDPVTEAEQETLCSEVSRG